MQWNLGQKILVAAVARNLTLKSVAKSAGISYNTLRGWTKRGAGRQPGAAAGVRLAKVLGVPADWLFSDAPDLVPPPRLEQPSFVIEPWPPGQLTWAEVQVAVAAFAMDKYIGLWQEVGKLSAESLAELHNVSPEMIEKAKVAIDLGKHLTSLILRMDEPETEPARKWLYQNRREWYEHLASGEWYVFGEKHQLLPPRERPDQQENRRQT